jgi:hypothetical protein
MARLSHIASCPRALFPPFVVNQENRKVVTPVLLDYFDPAEVDEELKVTFQDCAFDDNMYGGSVPMDLAVAGQSRQASLIVGNSQQNRIIIENTVFRNNDMLNNNSEVRE